MASVRSPPLSSLVRSGPKFGAKYSPDQGPREEAACSKGMRYETMHCILAVNHPIYQTGFSLSRGKRAHQSAKIQGRAKEHFGRPNGERSPLLHINGLSNEEGGEREGRTGGREGELIFRE